jgi:hypothetical protein
MWDLPPANGGVIVTAPTISSEHAAAVRAVNASFARLPKSVQDSIVIGWDALDRELDAALVSDDRPRALSAIRTWREHWLDVFEEAAR